MSETITGIRTFGLLVICAALAAALTLPGCNKNGETVVSDPGTAVEPTGDKGPEMRPHVTVPPITAYGWIHKANIRLGRQNEMAHVQEKIEDYYSGYPSFLKVLKLITCDRNVGLKDNPAYLTDVFSKYYELVGADEGDPMLSVQEYDVGTMKNALYLSWKKNNEFSTIDNYDDMVTSVDYGQ